MQQALLGLKREHKESIEQMRKDQDEALFKVSRFKQPSNQPTPSQMSQELCVSRVDVSQESSP